MEKAVVPSLGHLAFKVSYKEIIYNLLLCCDHLPEGKRLDLPYFASFLSTLTSETMIHYLRTKLDVYLAGMMSDEIRSKYVQKFFKTVAHHLNNEQVPDIWAFMDCVLDESFLSLETHAAFPNTKPDSKLITTIANRAPLLEKLKLQFILSKQSSGTENMKLMMLSLGSLNHLTSLTLSHLESSHFKSSLKFLGKSCPQLLNLNFIDSDIGKREILALMFGELIDGLLPKLPFSVDEPVWFLDANLPFLRVPSKFLTPICFTLQQLGIISAVDESILVSPISFEVVAFILCHLTKLQKMKGTGYASGKAIDMLCNANRPRGTSKIQATFEKACRKTAASLNLLPSEGSQMPFIYSPIFVGPLLLTKISLVSVVSQQLLQAISSACPFLKDVGFSEKSLDYFDSIYVSMYGLTNSPQILESIETNLRQWPKLETITLWEVSSICAEKILKVFGADLLNLTFQSCKKINLMSHLALCLRLENLRILSNSSSLQDSKEIELTTLNAATFLPLLKSFESDICLGDLSRYFEGNKSTLLHLSLNCCHIGTRVTPGLDWAGVSKAWPKLETLRVRQCTDLTLSCLSDLLPQMVRLKEIHLPNWIKWSERRNYSTELIETLLRQRPPIQIHFKPVRKFLPVDAVECALLDKEQEYTESGDEVESSYLSDGEDYYDEEEEEDEEEESYSYVSDESLSSRSSYDMH